MLLGEMKRKGESPSEESERGETSCYKRWPGTRCFGAQGSATDSVYGSERNPLSFCKMPTLPPGKGKVRPGGLQTILQARITTDHRAASPSHAWVGAQPGKSRAPLPASKCNITHLSQRSKQTTAARTVSCTNRRFL